LTNIGPSLRSTGKGLVSNPLLLEKFTTMRADDHVDPSGLPHWSTF
jgi:hypothetical protein